MKAALYIRVSTQELAKEGYSIGEQEESLRAYCQMMGWEVYDLYSDPGFSGGNINRPEIQRLISDVPRKLFDIVLVKKLDRLSRNMKDTLYLVEDVFEKNKVSFMSATENFDTGTPIGKALLGFMSTFAQWERETIKERTQTGIEERAKKGYYHGGPYAPIGYRYEDGELIINDYEAIQIKEIYSRFLSGQSVNRIYNYLNESGYTNSYASWNGHTAVYNILKNPLYAGMIRYKGRIYTGRHEAIISYEDWHTVQETFKKRKADSLLEGKDLSKVFKPKRLLGGLIHCKQCGATYFCKGNYSQKNKVKYYRPYYTCSSRGKKRESGKKCMNKSWPTNELDQIIISTIRSLSADPEYFQSVVENTYSEDSVINKKDTLNKRITEIDLQIKRLIDLYQIGSIPFDQISERTAALEKEKSTLLESLKQIPEVKNGKTMQEVQEILLNTDLIFEKGSMEEQQLFIRSLIDHIELDDEDIIIYWTFREC